jgi:hypothetical protein
LLNASFRLSSGHNWPTVAAGCLLVRRLLAPALPVVFGIRRDFRQKESRNLFRCKGLSAPKPRRGQIVCIATCLAVTAPSEQNKKGQSPPWGAVLRILRRNRRLLGVPLLVCRGDGHSGAGSRQQVGITFRKSLETLKHETTIARRPVEPCCPGRRTSRDFAAPNHWLQS